MCVYVRTPTGTSRTQMTPKVLSILYVGSNMPYCPECGEEIDEGLNFCPECGHNLTGDTASAKDDSVEQDTPEGQESPHVEGEPEGEVGRETDGINWAHAAKATAIGFVPALGAYMGVSIAAYQAIGIVLVLGIPIFGYLLYQRPTTKAMVGGASFWLAIEAFLTPLALLIYTFVFASQETMTSAGQAGAAIGGFVMVIVAFVVGFPIGIVLYLISGRLDVDSE